MVKDQFHDLKNEIVPFFIEKFNNKYPSKFQFNSINDIIIALTNENKLIGIIDYGGFCQYGKKGVVKTFRYANLIGSGWKNQGEIDCCGFVRMTDRDIPDDWKQFFSIDIMNSHSLRSARNC